MTTPPDILVDVTVPNGPSHIVTPDGHAHIVQVDETGRGHVRIKIAYARAIINSGTPESLAWKAVNEQLSRQLGPLPKPEAGIHIASYLQSLEAMRPLHPRDIRGTLRELGVLR